MSGLDHNSEVRWPFTNSGFESPAEVPEVSLEERPDDSMPDTGFDIDADSLITAMPDHDTDPTQPFTCCGEPVTDLSHDASELLVAWAGAQDYGRKSEIPRQRTSLDAPPRGDEILADVWGESNVMQPLAEMAKGDQKTFNHAIRVGAFAANTSLQLGLTEEEARIVTRAALLHDHGKLDSEVQAAIHSPRTVGQDPSLYNAIQRHPWHGVRLLTPYGHSPNVLQVVGNHHSLQTERPSYGVFSSMANLPETDGRRPDTQRALEIVAACDLFDAIGVAPHTGERGYQQHTGETYNTGRLAAALGSLRIRDAVRQAVFDLTNEELVARR